MELKHRFTVPAPLQRTWAAFEDIESVAGCFPGATVTSVEGDQFKGSCKVKLGPIALVYSGSGAFVAKDESAGRFVIEAKGKDKRGNGTAGATVTAQLSEAGASTEVAVTTDLAVTGKPAQFGRGVMQDVSDKLLRQFVDCLQGTLGSSSADASAAEARDGGSSVEAGEAAPSVAAAPVTAPSTGAGDGAETAGESGVESVGESGGPLSAPSAAYPTGAPDDVPPSSQQPDDALDLGATVLPVLLRSYGKPLAAALALLLLGWLLGRRSR